MDFFKRYMNFLDSLTCKMETESCSAEIFVKSEWDGSKEKKKK